MKHYRFTQHIVSISNSRGSRICGICAKLLPFPSEVNHELNKRAQISYTIGVRNQDLLTVGRRIRGVGIRNRPHLGDLELVEDVLKNFVVLDHLVLRLGVEVDLVHRHRPRVRRVHQLARHRPRRSLHETHTQIKSPHQEPRKKNPRPAHQEIQQTTNRIKTQGGGRVRFTSSTLERPSCRVVLIHARISFRPTK